MSRMTFSVAPDGLPLPALLGLDATAMLDQQAQGKPLPSPLSVRGQIDTGTVVTAVGPRVLAALGAIPCGASRTQTASGWASVQLFLISFTIFDAAGTTLLRPTWAVTDLPQDLLDVEVLFGMDLVRELVLRVDGPAGKFTLDF